MKSTASRLLAALLLSITAVTAVGLQPAGATAEASTAEGPPYSVPTALLEDALHCPTAFPNVERPVVFLVHGTSVTDEENWSWNYGLSLPRDGFDVCTVLLPDRALSDIQISAEYVVYGIREIVRQSGRKVSTIGLSQGPLEPRWALKWWPDLRPHIEDFVSMAGTNHGANYGDAACTPSCAPALWQQREHSDFLDALNADDETPGPAAYTSVYSLTDPIVQPAFPVATSALDGASNIAVQDICPGRPVDHIQSAFDAVYYSVVMDALLHPGPAVPARIDPLVCTQVAMPGVDPVFGAQKVAEVYLLAAQVQSAYPKTDAEPALACYVTALASCAVAQLPAAPPAAAPPAAAQPAAAQPVAAPGQGPSLAAGRSGRLAATGSASSLPALAAVGLLAGLVLWRRRSSDVFKMRA